MAIRVKRKTGGDGKERKEKWTEEDIVSTREIFDFVARRKAPVIKEWKEIEAERMLQKVDMLKLGSFRDMLVALEHIETLGYEYTFDESTGSVHAYRVDHIGYIPALLNYTDDKADSTLAALLNLAYVLDSFLDTDYIVLSGLVVANIASTDAFNRLLGSEPDNNFLDQAVKYVYWDGLSQICFGVAELSDSEQIFDLGSAFEHTAHNKLLAVLEEDIEKGINAEIKELTATAEVIAHVATTVDIVTNGKIPEASEVSDIRDFSINAAASIVPLINAFGAGAGLEDFSTGLDSVTGDNRPAYKIIAGLDEVVESVNEIVGGGEDSLLTTISDLLESLNTQLVTENDIKYQLYDAFGIESTRLEPASTGPDHVFYEMSGPYLTGYFRGALSQQDFETEGEEEEAKDGNSPADKRWQSEPEKQNFKKKIAFDEIAPAQAEAAAPCTPWQSEVDAPAQAEAAAPCTPWQPEVDAPAGQVAAVAGWGQIGLDGLVRGDLGASGTEFRHYKYYVPDDGLGNVAEADAGMDGLETSHDGDMPIGH